MNSDIPKLAVFSFPRSGRSFVRHSVLPKGFPTEASFLPGSPLYQSHDFRGDRECNDRPNIVLLRDPQECFASWFDLDSRNGGRPRTLEGFQAAVAEWVPYWKRFTRKHVLSGRCPVVRHRDLTTDPQEFYELVFELTGKQVCNPALEVRATSTIEFFPFPELLAQVPELLGAEYDEIQTLLR